MFLSFYSVTSLHPPSFHINNHSTCLIVAEDYTVHAESVLFSPRDTSATVTVEIKTDTVLESTERFLLTLSATNDSRVVINSERKETAVEILDTSGFKNFFSQFPSNPCYKITMMLI